jgi:signal transduction histidine kinase
LPIKNFTVCVKNEIKTEIPYSVNETGQFNEKEIQAEYNYILECYKSIELDKSSIESLINENKLVKYDPMPTAILGVPLIVKHDIQGALFVKDYSKSAFSKEDKELLELVADQLARVIERKKYEQDLINAKQRAEEAVKLKSDFLAQISHEIRTPLNSILSFSALLKNELQGKLSSELNETFNYIERGGNRLTRTIDLILNVSNSKNNQYKIRLEEINLTKDILEPLIAEFKDAALEKGIELDLVEPNEQMCLVCDQYSINQLFANLLENAIKYTNQGSVNIRTQINKFGNIQVDIEDTGIGISSDYLPKLFDPFSQEEQGYTRSYEGIGLGLSLVKSYAELNNAEIQVNSKKDIGTVFSVIFN